MVNSRLHVFGYRSQSDLDTKEGMSADEELAKFRLISPGVCGQESVWHPAPRERVRTNGKPGELLPAGARQ